MANFRRGLHKQVNDIFSDIDPTRPEDILRNPSDQEPQEDILRDLMTLPLVDPPIFAADEDGPAAAPMVSADDAGDGENETAEPCPLNTPPVDSHPKPPSEPAADIPAAFLPADPSEADGSPAEAIKDRLSAAAGLEIIPAVPFPQNSQDAPPHRKPAEAADSIDKDAPALSLSSLLPAEPSSPSSPDKIDVLPADGKKKLLPRTPANLPGSARPETVPPIAPPRCRKRTGQPRTGKKMTIFMIVLVPIFLVLVLRAVAPVKTSGPPSPSLKKSPAGAAAEGDGVFSFQPLPIDWHQPPAFQPPRRDPMQAALIVPMNTPVALQAAAPAPQRPDLIVSGIAFSHDRPAAVIGQSLVHIGDTIQGARVIAITRASVTFQFQGQRWTQYLAPKARAAQPEALFSEKTPGPRRRPNPSISSPRNPDRTEP